MAKTLKAFRLEPEIIKILEKLAKKNNRSQGNMLEVIIKEAADRDKAKGSSE